MKLCFQNYVMFLCANHSLASTELHTVMKFQEISLLQRVHTTKNQEPHKQK